jgi:MSHA pilin protein MshD
MKMRANRLHPRQSGVTLIELVISIVIISIGVAGILQVMNATTSRSADPMVREQAQLIAEAYMEEILLKKFWDPQDNRVCPLPPEASRDLYDNVCDYSGLPDNIVRDQFGTTIPGLGSYNVAVAVTTSGVNLNGLVNGPALDEFRVLRVDVTVTGPGDAAVTLSGYRTNYNCNTSGDAGCKIL